jgi:hypothetical protein
VIQPFDSGKFDKRFDDTFRPAILAAGFEPYRVDQDPATVVPIEDIEAGIRRSDVCFAEITTDNPNVWFELGFAIAARKPVIMVCATDRERFPFDVQHRLIIRYKTESAQDFVELGRQITKRLTAARENLLRVESVGEISPAAATSGLTDHELVALISIAANGFDRDPLSFYGLRQEMSRAGYTEVATALAVRGLMKKALIDKGTGYDDGSNEYPGFFATDAGLDWLEANQDRLKLKEAPSPDARRGNYDDFVSPPFVDDDDLPF